MMTVKAILFCILLAQTSASFFDEFRGAMSSVEDSFGKLVSDVVTDVRDTIGCTILAVKKVLALGGVFHESSEYDARCRGINPAPTYKSWDENIYYPPTPPITVTTTPAPKRFLKVKSIPESISDHVEESVKNVNYRINLIDKSDTHEKINQDSDSLLRESDRLTDVSAVLRRDLSSISKDVKMQLGKLESDADNPHVQGIWNEIKALHNMELGHRNTHEATVIHNILDDILSVLRGHEKRSDLAKESVNTDLDNTFIEIQKQFLKIEEGESQHFDMVKDIIKEDLPVKSEDELESNDKIMDETSRTFRFSENSQEYGETVSDTTEVPSATTKTEDDPSQSSEYAELFEIAPKDEAHSAKDIIEKSKQADAIMEHLFKQSSDVGYDLFDSPDLLDFGK